MDDYMKEMMDLKTLVTKTLEKKGVLARIRAELRANVFQAIEEQDHVSENEGGESFALLGRCSERAKQLHATPAGKLLNGLICEYLEWCELDRTLKVYLPELNQPRPYSRSELEELLEIKNDKNVAGVSSEARPLLLEVLEGYLKSETTVVKDSYAVSSSSFPKSSRTSSSLGSKPLMNGSEIGDDDLRAVLESRLTLSNKVVDPMTSSLDIPVERCSGRTWLPETCKPVKETASSLRSGQITTSAIENGNNVPSIRLDESLMDVDKPSGRLSLLGDLPPISGRRGGLAPIFPAKTSGMPNGLLASAGGNHEPFDVSISGLYPCSKDASGMQVSPGIGGDRDGGCNAGYPKDKNPSQDESAAHTSSGGKEKYGNMFEGGTQRCRRECEYDIHGSQRDVVSKEADSGTSGTLGSTSVQYSWGDGENEDNGTSCAPTSSEFGKSYVLAGNDTSLTKSESGEPCSSRQEATFQLLSPFEDKTTLPSTCLREKSASAYFYSESDDDASLPAEEDFNEDSDGQSDLQF